MPTELLSNIQYFEGLSYIGVLIALILSGHFVPIPQDVSLILLGYIVAHGYSNVGLMIFTGIIAAIIGDSILYTLAYTGSKFGQKIEAKIRNGIFDFVKRRMEAHTFWTMFIMRFIPGLRFASAVVAGYVKIPPKKFLSYNAFSSLFYVPFFFFIGFLLEDQITRIVTAIESARHAIVILLIAVLCLAIAAVLSKKIFKKNPTPRI